MHLEINGWDAGIKFSACHFIPGHGKCARLHGHIYALHAKVYGERNEKGMILDFIILKDAMRKIAEDLDHRILIPGESKEMELEIGEEIKVGFDGKRYSFPLDDAVVMDIKLASAEELAWFVLEGLTSLIEIPENVKAIEIGVDEGKGQGAWTRKVF